MAKVTNDYYRRTIAEVIADEALTKRAEGLSDWMSFPALRQGDKLKLAVSKKGGETSDHVDVKVTHKTLTDKNGESTGEPISWTSFRFILTRNGNNVPVYIPVGVILSAIFAKDGFSDTEIVEIRNGAGNRANAIYASLTEMRSNKEIVDALKSGVILDRIFTNSSTKKKGYRWLQI